MVVSLHDKEFAHVNSYCGYDAPENIVWDRSGNDGEIAVFTERCLHEAKTSMAKIKVAWLIEPPVIHDCGYKDIISSGCCDFDYLLTFDKPLLQDFPEKARWWTPGGTWLWRRDWGVAGKRRGVNIIATTKNWTEGHQMRQTVIDLFGGTLFDVYGYGRNPVENKIELKDYRFSVSIENCQLDWYWTDKLLDLFLMGTVPIYRGCPGVGEYFNTDGMLLWDTPSELAECLDRATTENYDCMLPAICDNYERALRFANVEDYLYESFFKEGDTNACIK